MRNRIALVALALALVVLSLVWLSPRADRDLPSDRERDQEARSRTAAVGSALPERHPDARASSPSSHQSLSPPELADLWSRRFMRWAGDREGQASFHEELVAASAELIPALEALLTDLSPLRALDERDVESGLAPPELGRRSLSLTLLQTITVDPNAPTATREQAESLLATVVLLSGGPEFSGAGTRVLLFEKGQALSTLARENPGRARETYRAIPDRDMRANVWAETKRALISSGMSRSKVRQIMRGFADA